MREKDRPEPIDPYTGKPSVFLPTDSLVQLAEKGEPTARHMVDLIGCVATLIVVGGTITVITCIIIVIRGYVTGEWHFAE